MPNLKLEEVVAVKARWEKKWLALPGVTGVDVGSRMLSGHPTEVLAIRIYVASKASAPPEILSLQQVEGVPVDVIERSFELH
jgi:hypothetical protein